MTIKDDDDAAALAAKAPRVSLALLESRIAAAHYITAAEALAGRGDPVSGAFDRVTLCIAQLTNGWTLIGTSSCAAAENFDPSLGRTLAHQDVLRQLWPLEGYLLREALSHAGA